MPSSLFQSDVLFGPQLPGHFDFTVLFEHTMLGLVPASLLVLATPFYVKGLACAERQVRPGNLLPSKIMCGLALVGMQATTIALWHNTDYFRAPVTVAASSMSLVASICTVFIIATTHMYSLRPSSFLSIFFSITMLFDITMARSYFLRDNLDAIAALQVCVAVLKLILISLEEVPKRSLFVSREHQTRVSVESTSGFWNRSLFIWLNPLLIFGWSNTFTLDNLPDIGDEFASERLFDRFSPHWGKVTFIGSILTGKKISGARAAWNAETEKRVAATSNMLAQLKSVKSMGLSGALSKYIEHKREVEIATSLRERYSLLWVFSFGAVNFTITPAIVFAGAYFWTRADHPMSVAEVFAILAVLAISSNPLIDLFRSVTLWSAAFASITRIQRFLLQPDRADPRDAPLRQDVAADGEKSAPPAPAASAERKQFAFELSDVSVTSPTTGPVLREVTFRIPWSSHTMMWGPINCGKSTLLKLLLGEVELNGGTVSAGSVDIAYCGQETWIENTTCQQAILGARQLIPAFYDEVVRACALDADFEQVPDGDQTRTGSGGCSLSGGQRQRLGLARSAYAQKEIIIVDDLFSAVDPETAGEIYTRLFGPQGIVRRWNCTVIITTNRLELLDYADKILQISKNGRVQEQHDTQSDGSSAGVESSDDESAVGGAADGRQQVGTDANEGVDTELPEVHVKEDDSGPQPKDEGSGGDLSVYKYFLGSAGILAVVFWMFIAMIAAVGEWLPVIYLRIWFVRDAESRLSFTGYGVFAVASVVFNVLNGAFYFRFVFPKTAKEMHRRLLKAVLGATPEFISDTDSGNLLNRFSQDITLVTSKLALLANQFVFLTFTTLVEIGMIAAGSPYAVPIMLFILTVLSAIQFFYLRSSRQLRQLELEASSSLFTRFTETSEGIHHVRSFGWQENFRRKLYAELDRSQKPTYLLYCIQRWLTLTMDLTSTVASLVLISLSLRLPRATSDAAVGLAMLSLIGFSSTATGFIQTWTAFETSLGAVRRIKLFVAGTPQEKDTLSGPPLPENWPAKGQIDFNAVSASYKTTDGGSHTALQSTTVTIPAGQKVGIMGRTGSGKSTMLSTILRMVEHTGSVSIDGRNTRHVPRELLRSRITTITQEGLRLRATLRFNVYPFEGAQPTDDQMIDVLQRVELWDHANLGGGLDAQYAAMAFSASQKQLMFLARGILHQTVARTQIVILDEVTSSLTLEAERDMRRIIDQAFAGCTVLLVSHRRESFLSTEFVLQFRSGQLFSMMRRRSTNGEWVEVKDF
ncbi:Vacuolar metal resistance and drug detoxification protein [Cordyceps javanica]|uniref:Vacuolar metal resistance and drug detoxification protein n=1 Tax=Cordyceps javanica TaxID=43265 RepID=A0A545VTA6_9HYPO|nr:Vacuolar metal resistance and drug detoxification protein [Cordyceps javanica]TQW04936.1 Vacuolar metal resistance and drug detoxification protein [Cordyceps javanica]